MVSEAVGVSCEHMCVCWVSGCVVVIDWFVLGLQGYLFLLCPFELALWACRLGIYV